MFKVIGLTGGIASGKSQVAKILRENGVVVVDADLLAKTLLDSNSDIQEKVKSTFGTLDRKKIREKIFSDAYFRKKLENILHPEIRLQSEKAFENAEKNGHSFAVYEAALLIETKWTPSYGHLDGLLVVLSSQELRLKRLQQRDTGKFVDSKILNSQCTDEDRRREATWIIENNGTLDELTEKTLQWLQGIKV